MPWYEHWFDSEVYEVVYRERDLDDARRMIALIEEVAGPKAGSRILDVACGRGRHARLLAQRGYQVTGVDLSPNAIATARRRASQEGLTVDFRVADMRELPFEREFDGVVNLFTSFGYFEDDRQHERAIEQMVGALVPGGFVVQDFLNPPYALAALVPEDERTLHDDERGELVVRQRRWVEENLAGRRIRKRIELCCFDHVAGEPDVVIFNESVRLFEKGDFERMYRAAGLNVIEAYGDYAGAPHRPESPRLILLARRPA